MFILKVIFMQYSHHIELLLKILNERGLIEKIHSIILGGSAVYNPDHANDIDLLIVCEDGFSDTVYKQIMSSSKYYETLKKILDIKVLEIQNIKHINNSPIAPFLYHFVQDSVLVYGTCTRNAFRVNDVVCYQTVIKNLEKIEEIKEIYYIFQDKILAQVLLYEIAKRFSVICQILLNNQEKKPNSFSTFLEEIYKNKLQETREIVNRKRMWVSIYKEDAKTGETGFNTLKLKINRKRIKVAVSEDSDFEELISRIKNLGNKCINLINY